MARAYTDEESNFIKDNWERMSNEELAEIMERPVMSVVGHARMKYGLMRVRKFRDRAGSMVSSSDEDYMVRQREELDKVKSWEDRL